MNPFEFNKADLQLTFITGLDSTGQPIFKTTTYKGIKENATATQVYTVAQALASLCEYSLDAVSFVRKETAIA